MTDRDHPKFGARWDDADDAVLIAGYATMGARWCAEQMPWRTITAIRTRAHAIKCAPGKAGRRRASMQRRERAIEAGATSPRWQPPAPRYASVFAMAQGVAV